MPMAKGWTLGRYAHSAFSLSIREKISLWDELTPGEKAAWEASALTVKAVIDELLDEEAKKLIG